MFKTPELVHNRMEVEIFPSPGYTFPVEGVLVKYAWATQQNTTDWVWMDRHLLSHNSGSWKSKIKVLVSSAPSEGLFLAYMASFLLCPHMTFP
jgi:hypothetical protein